MSRIALIAAVIGALAITGACGQKGPLYLPQRNGEVITRPGQAAPAQTPQQDPDKDKDKQKEQDGSQQPK